MKKNWSPDKIRYELAILGLTMADVGREYKVKPSIIRQTIRIPHTLGEDALAAALNVKPQEIWPNRYNMSGERLSPQPPENYISLPRFRTSKKSSVA